MECYTRSQGVRNAGGRRWFWTVYNCRVGANDEARIVEREDAENVNMMSSVDVRCTMTRVRV
jgi:hypothetical protein